MGYYVKRTFRALRYSPKEPRNIIYILIAIKEKPERAGASRAKEAGKQRKTLFSMKRGSDVPPMPSHWLMFPLSFASSCGASRAERSREAPAHYYCGLQLRFAPLQPTMQGATASEARASRAERSREAPALYYCGLHLRFAPLQPTMQRATASEARASRAR